MPDFLQRHLNALGLRYQRQIAFVRARLAPQSYLGLQLTLGALALICASWLFGSIAEDVVSGDALTVMDVRLAQRFYAHATASLTPFMFAVSDLHGPAGITIMGLMMATWLAWRRNWYGLACLAAVLPLGMVVNSLMKYAFQRARPSFEAPLLVLSSYSFPSGHVAAATLLYGMLVVLVCSQTPAWRWRSLAAMGAGLMVVLVALSRMYLGVHYLSDVLAAFAEGVAWLALCLTAVNTFRNRVGGIGQAAGLC